MAWSRRRGNTLAVDVEPSRLPVGVVGRLLRLAVGVPVAEVGDEGEPLNDEPPITSIDDIDPDKCNWIHNINACEEEPEPGIAVGEYMVDSRASY